MENEHSLLKNDHHTDSQSSMALTVCIKSTKPPNTFVCGNPVCKKTGHSTEYCIKAGGGMARKTIEESVAVWRVARDKGKKVDNLYNPNPRVPITVKDINGCAFTVMVDSEPSKPKHNTHPPFTRLTSDLIPTVLIEEVEYEGWVVVEEKVTTTVDLTCNTSTPEEGTFTIKPLNQTQCSRASLINFPFIIDTGATVHSSLDKGDFLTLCPISPHPVKGVGGSSIIAIGVGNIRLHIAQGASIILCNALYIPNEMV